MKGTASAEGCSRAEPADGPVARGPGLSLFCAWAGVLEPLSFASLAAAGLGRIVDHGPPALALLALRLATTGLGMAAARAIWTARAGARGLACLWIALSAAAVVLTFVTPYFPGNRPPSTKRLELAGLLAVHAGCALYLAASPHVRRFVDSGRAAADGRLLGTSAAPER